MLFLLKIIQKRPDQGLAIGEFKGIGHFLSCCLPFGKARGLQIPCFQGFAVEVLRLHP